MMDEMTIRVAIRATARISFVLFLGAFLGDALYRLMPAAATRWLKANKDGFTLGFAGSHTVHLVFILALVAAIGREQALKRVMLVAFTTGYLFIYGLAADVLFRHRKFLPARFEALAHYYLSFRGQLHATRTSETPFLHSVCSCRCDSSRVENRRCCAVEKSASPRGKHIR
jgi:hypothetical protein